MPFITPPIKSISEVMESLTELIFKRLMSIQSSRLCSKLIHDTKRYLIPTTLTMKTASKREQSQVLLEHCRAGAGSTEGQCDGIASLMNVEADFIKEALDAGLYKHTTRITSSILLQTSSFVHRIMAVLLK